MSNLLNLAGLYIYFDNLLYIFFADYDFFYFNFLFEQKKKKKKKTKILWDKIEKPFV